LPTLRALAQELNRHRQWTIAVGVRQGPAPRDGLPLDADRGASAIMWQLRKLTHRADVATTTSWDAVKNAPGAASSGIGFIIGTPETRSANAPKTEQAAPKKEPK
jgi:hypothetical protein